MIESTSFYDIVKAETTALFEAVVSLRYEVLRKDWDQPFSSASDQYDGRDDTVILAAVHNLSGEVLATARLQPYKEEQWAQVRYVAVHKEWQKKGLGTAIMQAIHQEAKHQGYTHIYLEAREIALPMYRKLGYQVLYFLDMRLGRIPHYVCEIALL